MEKYAVNKDKLAKWLILTTTLLVLWYLKGYFLEIPA
jgi:hypothetical protein